MASYPTKIGKYNVEGVIGRGGMGVVYKAVDSQIGRYVAIKMITSGGDPSLLERFRIEARSTGSLTCPNIVTVYDFGEQDGNPYLVMQFLEGHSLDSMIQKGASLTLPERLGIIIDVCNGLAYAHQRGVIHRDIKPGNIMVLQDGVNDGMAVIVDFGIARIGGNTRLTKTDQIIGSVHYMSVEQLQAKELDNRTDIYATGVVLFQLLTGVLPFDSPDTAATLLKIVNEPPPPLSTYLKEYPVELEAIVGRALAKKREERYASAKDLAFDLTQVQEHLRSETVLQLFQRAEVSFRREEWTRAREHLQQVLRLDRQNTQAQKLMTSVQERLRQLQQIEQARALRAQADEAFMDQRYDDALRLLEQAVVLDGSNSDLVAFRDSVRMAKERATGLRRALRRAEAALQDGDLDEAQNAVGEAFKIDPQDTQAKALKVIIAQQAEEKLRQEQLRKLLDQARNQIAARNLTVAFTILKDAEALDPSSNELKTVVKLAMAAREQDKRRAETEAFRQQIEAALNEEDYATAVAKADEGLLKFPHEQSLLKLKALVDAQRLRVEQKKFVREQFSAAHSLADAGQFRQAVAVLERALQRAPGNSELESLRATFLDRLASEDAKQRRQQAVETTLAEGERILRERGARDATEFLAARATEYSDSQKFRELYDSVRERGLLDALDSRLASEPNPALQLQLAEEALRNNPNNRWIQQRVADLRRLRDQVNAIIERAQGLEKAGRFPEAIQQWQQLSKSYPQFPEFEAHVRRIASLEANRKKAVATPPAPVAVAPPKREESGVDFSATRMLNSSVLPGVQPPKAEPKAETVSGTARPPVVPQPKKIEPPPDRISPPKKPTPPALAGTTLLAGPKKYIALASAVIVLIVLVYLIWPGKKTVIVRINTTPADANVTVGKQKCQHPCELPLLPGTYEVRVERDGYETVTKQVPITADTKSLSMIELVQSPPPKPQPALEQGTLIVRTNMDEADVLVDGNLNGSTGRDRKFQIPLTVGTYQITVRKSGYEEQPAKTVEIAKNKTNPVEFVLKKTSEPATQHLETYLLVKSQPEASVAIDQHPVGRVPVAGTLSVKVDPKTHTVDVTLPGYKPFSRAVAPKEGDRLPIDAKLDPIPPPAQPPRIVSFTREPSSITSGQSAQLSWQTDNADEVLIDGGRVEKSGSKQVTPTANTTYTLTAKGPGGAAPPQSVAVTVIPKPVEYPPASIVQFKAAPPSIHEGESTTLFWSTQNAVNVTIDQGQGKVEATGSVEVKPAQTTKYTLTAKGQSGDVRTDSMTVTVKPAEVTAVEPPANPRSDMKCVARFKDAYESLVIEDLQKVWPSLDSKRRNQIKDSFKGAQAIKLEEQQCVETPTGSADTAQYKCSETLTYTINGKRQPPTKPNAIEFTCRKTATGWVVDNRTVK